MRKMMAKGNGMTKRCRHRTSWILASGGYLWCYRCGALRVLAKGELVKTRVKTSKWFQPTGPRGSNPYTSSGETR